MSTAPAFPVLQCMFPPCDQKKKGHTAAHITVPCLWGCMRVACIIPAGMFRSSSWRSRYSEISGFHGVVAGLLVAVKQLTPDTEVTLLQALKFRAKACPHSPLLSFCVHVASLWDASSSEQAQEVHSD